jgi:hypothetical protein
LNDFGEKFSGQSREYWVDKKVQGMLDDFLLTKDKFSYFLFFTTQELESFSKTLKTERDKIGKIYGKLDILIRGVGDTIILKKRTKAHGGNLRTPDQHRRYNESLDVSLLKCSNEPPKEARLSNLKLVASSTRNTP